MGVIIVLNSKEILRITHGQFALDYNCDAGIFEHNGVYFTENTENRPGRRVYSDKRPFLELCVMHDSAVFCSDPAMTPWLREHFYDADPKWLSEYENLRQIDKKLNEFGHKIYDTHIFFLPTSHITRIKPKFTTMWYGAAQINRFRGDDRFPEAFLFRENTPDSLAVSAIDTSGAIMGMAGASADGGDFWQIGIDVMPQYRGRGIAKTLVNNLALEILRMNKVPFYGTAASHSLSRAVAVKAHFIPSFMTLYSKKCDAPLAMI
ncbi:MAG: GNAT family N-acetyltransferase [Eubacteriales bacterium]